MNLKGIKGSNKPRVSDNFNPKVSTLLGMLTNKVSDSELTVDCDDIILAASESGISDQDVILAWETDYATDSEKKAFMDYISEELDQAESLDDDVYDYCIHQHLDFSEVVALLNGWLSREAKLELCKTMLTE